ATSRCRPRGSRCARSDRACALTFVVVRRRPLRRGHWVRPPERHVLIGARAVEGARQPPSAAAGPEGGWILADNRSSTRPTRQTATAAAHVSANSATIA